MSSSAPFSLLGPAFWFAYIANTALMIAVSVMFRYADFVSYLGGSEYELGWIVGIGMLGALAMRFLQGRGIDRYGAGNVWVASVGLALVTLLAHLSVQRIDTPWIYVLRILYTISLAGAFGASITFVSLRAPAHRTGETIGALGSSGFIGMAVGPVIADMLFSQPATGRAAVDRMFLWAAGMSLVAFVATLQANALGGPDSRSTRRRQVPIWWLLRRYHPGAILLVGIATGMGIGIPFYFLGPFVEQLGIPGIRGFFLVYSGVAFVARVACRRLPDRWGVRQTVILGMGFLAAEFVSFLAVHDRWTLLLPAILGGVAHAFVFPAAMADGSLAFPMRYRGLATALMLTVFDLGSLIGQPAVGSLLKLAQYMNWPAYPLMYLTVAMFLLAVLAIYVRSTASSGSAPRQPRKDRLDAADLAVH